MCPDKFVFGLHDGAMRAELLKTHLKLDGETKNMQEVVAEAEAFSLKRPRNSSQTPQKELKNK